MPQLGSWFYWALLSALFAALTAIFAKVGLQGVDSDFATLIRTAVILVVIAVFVYYREAWVNPLALPGKSWLFLVLSALATGASWLCYFRALKSGNATQVAPIDKLSLVIVTVLAVVLLGERPNAETWIGILLISAGVVLIGLRG